ncbi:M23 family metallopeptidase [Candidatus Woesearchaeota archaeon]|nr:M23 family metallopeptidase [Candidatus Woesearchaeota archaeon]
MSQSLVLEERAQQLAREIPDSVRKRIESTLGRRDALVVLAREAPRFWDALLRTARIQGNKASPEMYDIVKPVLDISNMLKQPATRILNRRFPAVAPGSDGRRADFDGHLRPPVNPLTGASGVDYGPLSGQRETYVTPVAGGVLYGKVENKPVSGNMIWVLHGNGYISLYSHLAEILEHYIGIRVDRFTRIGIMGNTGAGARDVHLHTSFFGPAFNPFLKGTKTQDHYLGETVSPYVKNPEEFSVMGQGKPLPYPVKDDEQLDREYVIATKQFRKEVDEYLGILPHYNKIHPQRIMQLQSRMDVTLDRDIFYLYHTILSRRDGSKELVAMKARLEQMMLTTPRLTAPILEPV